MRRNYTTTLDTMLLAKLKMIAAFENCDVNDIIERVMLPFVEDYTLFKDRPDENDESD
jgi:hypothetical protein